MLKNLNFSHKSFYILILATVLLGGCSLPVEKGQQSSAQTLAEESDHQSSLQRSMVHIPEQALHLGSQIRIPKQRQPGVESAKIEALFFSALGQQCIYAEVVENNQKRLFCEHAKEHWQEMPLIESLAAKPVK